MLHKLHPTKRLVALATLGYLGVALGLSGSAILPLTANRAAEQAQHRGSGRLTSFQPTSVAESYAHRGSGRLGQEDEPEIRATVAWRGSGRISNDAAGNPQANS
ncbi:hypothetical protein [Leptolyngbya sp. PCC 6406]|uniref:hypothetical protein n=1 Tax=Leptolyngbya sp. PCC 6406 TaxID=1173264 RepID=UPI0002ACF6B5|nr:hypothetical protein [Leptolyngbya sp. PCC 6406]